MKLMTIIKTLALAVAFCLTAAAAVQAADIKLRATANSNENDEDYDGLTVFKNYVEQASNGAITVEIFMGTQLCSNGTECLQGVAGGDIDIAISTSGGFATVLPFAQVLVAAVAIIIESGGSGPSWPLDILILTGFFCGLWLLSAWLFRIAARSNHVPGGAV